jgi:hypothetical protein
VLTAIVLLQGYKTAKKYVYKIKMDWKINKRFATAEVLSHMIIIEVWNDTPIPAQNYYWNAYKVEFVPELYFTILLFKEFGATLKKK